MSDFIDGKTRTAAGIAAELIPILAMWGINRNTARRAMAAAGTTLAGMSDAEYERMANGLKIKGGNPTPTGNDNAKG